MSDPSVDMGRRHESAVCGFVTNDQTTTTNPQFQPNEKAGNMLNNIHTHTHRNGRVEVSALVDPFDEGRAIEVKATASTKRIALHQIEKRAVQILACAG